MPSSSSASNFRKQWSELRAEEKKHMKAMAVAHAKSDAEAFSKAKEARMDVVKQIKALSSK